MTTTGSSWVQRVRETSDAMDLPPGIFKREPAAIARGLKRSVMRSRRTRGTKFQSAMSMLNLYVNRAGRSLSKSDRSRLELAKRELEESVRSARGVEEISTSHHRTQEEIMTHAHRRRGTLGRSRSRSIEAESSRRLGPAPGGWSKPVHLGGTALGVGRNGGFQP